MSSQGLVTPVAAIGVIAVAAYLFFGRSSAKPAPKRIAVPPPASTPQEVSQLCARVASKAKEWSDLPYTRKIEYLDDILERLAAYSEEIGKVMDHIRGNDKAPFAEYYGNTGFATIAFGAGFLRELREVYCSFRDENHPPRPLSVRKVNDAEVAVLAPRPGESFDKTVVEMFSLPGTKLTQRPALERHTEKDGVSAVLGAGNFENPTDILHKMFIENRVVVAKSHPINAPATELVAKLCLARLIEDGYLGIVSSSVEAGQALLHDPHTTNWMMTGGCGTFDAIVFGGPTVREDNKKSNRKLLDKPYHAELGAASPYLVVPGEWSASELSKQAQLLVGYKVLNSGHICASPQVVLLDKQWPQAQAFVDELRKYMKTLPPMTVYYPGTQDKIDNLLKICPGAEQYRCAADGSNALRLVFVPDVDAPGGGGDYLVKNELFAPGLAIKYLDGRNDANTFLEAAVRFANEDAFGSLSCSIVISDSTRAKLTDARLDQFIQRLKWGAVHVNAFPVASWQHAFAKWGAPPGRHCATDIRSGEGEQGNAFLLDNVEKAVVRGIWCDPLALTMFGHRTKKSPAVLGAIGSFALSPSYSRLMRVIAAIVSGY